jgi:hypothetical protein
MTVSFGFCLVLSFFFFSFFLFSVGTMAVLSGLCSPSVERLTFSFSTVPEKELDRFKEIKSMFEPQKNYSKLRNVLSTLVDDSIVVVPYLGCYMTDIVFILEGNPDYLDEGLINWKKRRLLYESLGHVSQFLNRTYEFEVVGEKLSLLCIFILFTFFFNKITCTIFCGTCRCSQPRLCWNCLC